MFKHHKHLALILSTSLLLGGCAALESLKNTATDTVGSLLGIENNTEPPAELVQYKPEINLDVLWKEQIGIGKDKQILKLDLAINGDKIFAADRDGLVQARNIDNGRLVWEANLEQPLSAGPGIGNGTLILGSSTAKVTALDSASGAVLWTAPVSSEVLSVPVVGNGIVIVRTTDGVVAALNEKTGQPLWTFNETLPALTLRGISKPVIANNRILLGFANGKLMALQLDNGGTVWETLVAMPTGRSEVERLVDLTGDPLEKDGVLFITSYRGGTSAVLASDGNIVWRNEQLSSANGLAADWRYLYISDTNSDVWQIDPRNGSTLWKQNELHFRALTAPLAYQEYIVVGDYDGYLHWLSRSDGRQMARVQIASGAIDTKPVAADDVVYVYAKDGTLAAVKARIY